MKKQLLLCSTLLASALSFSQSGFKIKPTGITNMAQKMANKYAKLNSPQEKQGVAKPIIGPENQAVNSSPSEAASSVVPSATWQAIGGSMNIYGVLTSQSQPLNYNDNLNTISFIHRKGNSYNVLPSGNSNTGAMIARVSNSWGQGWDSTCFWSNPTNLGRYPQGGIYNPPGNTNLSNAYIVGMGPVTDGTNWTGNWYASKQLGAGNYNATASGAAGAQQYIANTPPFNVGLAKHDFPRSSFCATDDGAVRTIGTRYYGYDIPNGAPTDFRGAAIVKGTFNAGTFTWTSDTIIPDFVTRTNLTKQAWDEPVMAWNESGSHGYMVFIGAAATATGSNKGWQPIVYKTSNSGVSWAQISGIDFNNISFAPIKAHIASTNVTPTLEIPFFKIDEGYDVTVDINNKLHIISTIVGGSSSHNDSLEYTFQFGTEKYSWAHTPGNRPYLYDFVGDGTGPWTYMTIDSLSSEGPGSTPTSAGYNDNPWDVDQNSKVTSDCRSQISRTPDGKYLIYSWAESDSLFTNGQKKWNTLPNIKARALITGTSTILSPTKWNVTKPTPPVPGFGTNNNVANRAMFHYQSPTALFINCIGSLSSSSVQLRVPYTVSNSNPYGQLNENKHWFAAATLDFLGLEICTGFQQSLAYNVNAIDIYPNPANSNATIAIDLKEEGNVNVNVYNTIGALVKSISAKGNVGENKMNVDLNNLSAGIYMVKINVGNTTSTKKLIVQ